VTAASAPLPPIKSEAAAAPSPLTHPAAAAAAAAGGFGFAGGGVLPCPLLLPGPHDDETGSKLLS
jgi:hypothetical protein